MSADNFYYGALYMLSQLTLNLEGHGNPGGTNCWTWEADPVEGTKGWVPPGIPTPGKMNQLYATDSAQVSGCMPIAYSSMQANGFRHNVSFPLPFVEYCKRHPEDESCYSSNTQWSGGGVGTDRFENAQDQEYVFAVVVDATGYWIYRWIPDSTGSTGWPGVSRHHADRVLPPRPKPVTDKRGLVTNVPGDVAEAVIYQPSLLPEASCLRSSIEPVNWQFGSDAFGSIAFQLNKWQPGKAFEGAQNWWAHFSDTQQYANYPPSIAGRPPSSLKAAGNSLASTARGKQTTSASTFNARLIGWASAATIGATVMVMGIFKSRVTKGANKGKSKPLLGSD